ncbi:MAG: glutamine synthetase beta-grasp domain-containing protein, partial [Myxococcota bacterium]
MKREEILKEIRKEGVKFLRLQFTDVLGINKNVEVPPKQFEKALDGEIMFDGSSIEGFARIEESDMTLVPDLNTFMIFPWEEKGGKVARLICDIYTPDGRPFDGCTRTALKRVIEKVRKAGYIAMAGTEMEFFLFQTDPEGKPTTETHDDASYFDMTPVDRGEEARRTMINVLENMGFEVEAGHHEVARGQ